MLLRLALSVVALGVFGVGLYLNQTEETYVVYSVPLEGESEEVAKESDEDQINENDRFATAPEGLEKFEENKDSQKPTTEEKLVEDTTDPTLL